ncbi:Transcriptional activator hacA-like protein [Penicillium ucsense]|uniref:Transcriptional activator hacA-like protein n=1 Tax=Penicillium ucsense TaxID=2839758 RepID=A0A8J8VVB5_9EURO|nr:Transcriptional activator hacA-like protein [Penicillium ucsense]KAF7722406.1 Transcriptional activator hacA-like protein [Penicillium ucsense]
MEETTSLRELESLVTPEPEMEMPLTISPSDTSLQTPAPGDEDKEDEKKPAKKRKSWGQELPVPKTNLPPRKRAKTEDEKEQRRIERVLRNRAAAQTSRERKRLEMEKLETEKIRMEQQNEFLLQRLAQMEAENNRLSQQVAQLSAEVRGSRSSTPVKASTPGPVTSFASTTTTTTTSPATATATATATTPSINMTNSAITSSPTLTPTLFKQEGEDLLMERIPFPTPSTVNLEYSPTLKPSTLAEASSDVTQHPAAMLCPSDLQCPSVASKESEPAPAGLSPSSTSSFQLTLATTLQLLFLTMTSVASSTVTLPLLQILHSLKTGSPLALSTAAISQHFPLIHWLISTPSLSPSTATGPFFRMRLLTRLLACSPALARPLRDATGRALQLAVREQTLNPQGAASETQFDGRPSWTSLLTMTWAIDSITSQSRRRRRAMGAIPSYSPKTNQTLSSTLAVQSRGIGKRTPPRGIGRRRSYGKISHIYQDPHSRRSSWSSSTATGETSSVLSSKQL